MLGRRLEEFANREFSSAASYFDGALQRQPKNGDLYVYALYAMCMSGDRDQAQSLASQANGRLESTGEGRELQTWFAATFDLRF